MKNYLLDAVHTSTRSGNYERRAEVAALFSNEGEIDINGSCGNIGSDLFIDKETRKCRFDDKLRSWDSPGDCAFYEAISSPLLLYRLICTFPALSLQVWGSGGYKSVWHYKLIHRATDERIAFGEHKGGVSFWTRFHELSEVPDSMKADLVALIDYLLSDECAHPYDGTVAGAVA